MVLKYKCKGLIAPVFTPFNSKFELNLKEIPKYARIFSETDVKGILVNGTAGEGVSMTTEERKLVAEAWSSALNNTNLSFMVHVGGTNLKSVCELAKHAETIRADAILCLADVFFKPATATELVRYLQKLSDAAPQTPLLYYHIPSFTGININMKEFFKKAYLEIPTFAGTKYTHNDLEEASYLTFQQQDELSLFLGNDSIIPGALSMGVESFILTSLNFAPKLIQRLVKLKGNDVEGESISIQRKLNQFTADVISQVAKTPSFKTITSLANQLELGDARAPFAPITEKQLADFKLAYSKLI